MEVVVVGAGVAGTAAAWSARKRGASVTVVRGPVGATELSGGAIDDVVWTSRDAGPVGALSSEAAELVQELGLWNVPAASSRAPRVATTGGLVRACRGHDRSLLDLGSIEPGIVAIPRADRPGWDADALADSFDTDPWARERGLSFRAVDFTVLRRDDERAISDSDIAARHDEDARRQWLVARLRFHLQRARGTSAILLGAWLGASAPRGPEIGERVGVPVGEALVAVGSPAGLRFAAARDRLLQRIGATTVDGWAESVEAREGALAVRLSNGDVLRARRVVLAIGGVAGGGIVYTPPDHEADEDLPPAGSRAFSPSLSAPVQLAARGVQLDVLGSMHGPDIDETAWPAPAVPGILECVGLKCHGVVAAPRITSAGDAIADRPRTMLEAVTSGIAAGA